MPSFPPSGRDLRLEPLGDRDPQGGGHLGDIAQFATPFAVAEARKATRPTRAREALIDAVFTAAGVGEWLHGLAQAVAALVAGKDKEAASPDAARREAIRACDPNLKRP